MSHDHACGSGHSESTTTDSCCKGEAHKAGGQCCKDQAAAAPVANTPKELFNQIEALDNTTIVMRYRRGIEYIDRRIFELVEEQIDQAFLPDAGVGQWPVRVLIGHLADAELTFVHRMRRAVGEGNPVVAVWDENAFIDARIYGDGPKKYADEPEADHARVMAALGGPLAVVHTLRQWHGQWLLSLTDAQWRSKVLHPERGEQTLRTILNYATWHLEHHAVFLNKKLDHVLGPVPDLPEGGGCGSGCGCRH